LKTRLGEKKRESGSNSFQQVAFFSLAQSFTAGVRNATPFFQPVSTGFSSALAEALEKPAEAD
jgi:hypothetical protein